MDHGELPRHPERYFGQHPGWQWCRHVQHQPGFDGGNGRKHQGYPAVRFWSIWNEPNLNQFLAPQYDGKGKIVSAANYAKLYRAAYAGREDARA